MTALLFPLDSKQMKFPQLCRTSQVEIITLIMFPFHQLFHSIECSEYKVISYTCVSVPHLPSGCVFPPWNGSATPLRADSSVWKTLMNLKSFWQQQPRGESNKLRAQKVYKDFITFNHFRKDKPFWCYNMAFSLTELLTTSEITLSVKIKQLSLCFVLIQQSLCFAVQQALLLHSPGSKTVYVFCSVAFL